MQLTEKHRPRKLEDFAGLDKPKKIMSRFVQNPFATAFLFSGAPGTGKTSLALAACEALNGELHHIGSQQCNLDTLNRVAESCQYSPLFGSKWHVILIDEVDSASTASQLAMLSYLDSTKPLPNTIWFMTCNSTERLEARFLSRLKQVEFSTYGLSAPAAELLEKIWKAETDAPVPNLARIVKDNANNIRGCLQALEMELMCA